MSKKYFAYGSCTNLESFKETMKKAGCEDKIHICGVGRLNDYRLAFTRDVTRGRGYWHCWIKLGHMQFIYLVQ